MVLPALVYNVIIAGIYGKLNFVIFIKVIIVSDYPASNLTYRLRGGPSNNEGRLEVNYAGKWGTVCDDDFTSKAAKVVCDALKVT